MQIRASDSALGVFTRDPDALASAGLAIVADGTYYPAGGPRVTAAVGERTPVSGPVQTITGQGVRVLESRYFAGPALEITERVIYANGEHGVHLRYAIRNASGKSVAFRAGQLASLPAVGTPVFEKGMIGLRAPDGSQVRIHEEGDVPWNAEQTGTLEQENDVYRSFAGSGLPGAFRDEGNQIGVQYKVDELKPGETKVIELRWEVDDATAELAVTTTEDDDQPCTKDHCSLRAGFEQAPKGSVIRVPAGTFVLTRGPLTVGSDRIVRGAGAGRTSILPDKGGRVLTVDRGGLGLSGVRITGGTTDGGDPNGAGIWVRSEGALALADSRVDHNHAIGDGGGLFLQGETSIVRSTIDANTANAGPDARGPGGYGGGLRSTATLSLVNVTISGNQADVRGGGLETSETAELTNVTVTANQAPLAAGFYHLVTTHRADGRPALPRPGHDRRDRRRQHGRDPVRRRHHPARERQPGDRRELRLRPRRARRRARAARRRDDPAAPAQAEQPGGRPGGGRPLCDERPARHAAAVRRSLRRGCLRAQRSGAADRRRAGRRRGAAVARGIPRHGRAQRDHPDL